MLISCRRPTLDTGKVFSDAMVFAAPRCLGQSACIITLRAEVERERCLFVVLSHSQLRAGPALQPRPGPTNSIDSFDALQLLACLLRPRI